jgi:hypothetical protein
MQCNGNCGHSGRFLTWLSSVQRRVRAGQQRRAKDEAARQQRQSRRREKARRSLICCGHSLHAWLQSNGCQACG